MSPACLSAAIAHAPIILIVSSGIFFVSSLAVLGAALGVSLTASTSASTTASACASNSMASNSGNTAATSAATTASAGTASSIVTTAASTISANGTTTGAPTTISVTATSTYCVTTPITSGVTASPTPAQCTNATLISDATRSPAFQGAYSCDAAGPLANPGWFQFTGPGGMILANCVVPSNLCGAQGTGWYSGVYPSTPGQTLDSTACFNWNGNSCNWFTSIKITNCNGYYVFYLTPPPVCNLRYCTV